jgi:hypothetical protein
LYAKDRGCSAPGCDVSGYHCKVHHVTDYATCHTTDVNDLTFGCGPQHRLLKPGGRSTSSGRDVLPEPSGTRDGDQEADRSPR